MMNEECWWRVVSQISMFECWIKNFVKNHFVWENHTNENFERLGRNWKWSLNSVWHQFWKRSSGSSQIIMANQLQLFPVHSAATTTLRNVVTHFWHNLINSDVFWMSEIFRELFSLLFLFGTEIQPGNQLKLNNDVITHLSCPIHDSRRVPSRVWSGSSKDKEKEEWKKVFFWVFALDKMQMILLVIYQRRSHILQFLIWSLTKMHLIMLSHLI